MSLSSYGRALQTVGFYVPTYGAFTLNTKISENLERIRTDSYYCDALLYGTEEMVFNLISHAGECAFLDAII